MYNDVLNSNPVKGVEHGTEGLPQPNRREQRLLRCLDLVINYLDIDDVLHIMCIARDYTDLSQSVRQINVRRWSTEDPKWPIQRIKYRFPAAQHLVITEKLVLGTSTSAGLGPGSGLESDGGNKALDFIIQHFLSLSVYGEYCLDTGTRQASSFASARDAHETSQPTATTSTLNHVKLGLTSISIVGANTMRMKPVLSELVSALSCSSLKYLEIKTFEFKPSWILKGEEFNLCKNLETLILPDFTSLTLQLENMSCLKSLHIGITTYCSFLCVPAQLEDLCLVGSAIQPRMIEAILRTCSKSLRRLTLRSAPKLQNSLTIKCPFLEVLDIQHCSKLKELYIKAPSCRVVNLDGCINLELLQVDSPTLNKIRGAESLLSLKQVDIRNASSDKVGNGLAESLPLLSLHDDCRGEKVE